VHRLLARSLGTVRRYSGAASSLIAAGSDRSANEVAGLDRIHPHMLRTAFMMASLDAGVPLRDVQIAARHADPRTTTIYDRRRQNYDRHAACAVVAFVTNG
jgi:integrase